MCGSCWDLRRQREVSRNFSMLFLFSLSLFPMIACVEEGMHIYGVVSLTYMRLEYECFYHPASPTTTSSYLITQTFLSLLFLFGHDKLSVHRQAMFQLSDSHPSSSFCIYTHSAFCQHLTKKRSLHSVSVWQQRGVHGFNWHRYQ